MPAHKLVTWLGDADPQVQTITDGGVTFVKGRPEKVSEGHSWIGKFSENPHFSVDDDAEVEDAGEDDEIAAVKASLDAKGVKYRANASLSSLRTLLAANTDTGEHDDPKIDQVGAVDAQDMTPDQVKKGK
jgi:hypothetical protein